VNAVQELTPEDWALWRALRIEATTTEPEAFGSTLDEVIATTDAQWRTRLGEPSLHHVACQVGVAGAWIHRSRRRLPEPGASAPPDPHGPSAGRRLKPKPLATQQASSGDRRDLVVGKPLVMAQYEHRTLLARQAGQPAPHVVTVYERGRMIGSRLTVRKVEASKQRIPNCPPTTP
jgi:hypothetical protein